MFFYRLPERVPWLTLSETVMQQFQPLPAPGNTNTLEQKCQDIRKTVKAQLLAGFPYSLFAVRGFANKLQPVFALEKVREHLMRFGIGQSPAPNPFT